MNTVLRFDRVVLTKELNEKFKQVGDEFEVANILEDSFLLRSAKTKVALGVVSFEDFEKHFVHENNFKGWTNWTPLVGFDGHSDCFYRTNRKKVQVKFLTDKVRAECCCCKDDDFNLSFGVQLAYLRCLNKAREKQWTELEEKKNELEKELNAINEKLNMARHEFAENKSIIKKMVNSLDT